MGEILSWLSTYIGYIVAIGTGLGAIYKWVAQPLQAMAKKTSDQLEAIKRQNAEQDERLKLLDNDTADLLCSQLTREHDYYLRLGFCPSADKARLRDIYERYHARGRNHMADTYVDEIYRLPNAYEEHK